MTDRKRYKQKWLVLFLVVVAITAIGTKASAEQNIRVIIDGVEQKFSPAPLIENGRVLVPMRQLFETLGAEVTWYEDSRMVVGKRNGITVCIFVDSNFALVNGQEYISDVPPRIIENRTFLPLRFVAETLGDYVTWDRATRTITIQRRASQAPVSPEPQHQQVPPVPIPSDVEYQQIPQTFISPETEYFINRIDKAINLLERKKKQYLAQIDSQVEEALANARETVEHNKRMLRQAFLSQLEEKRIDWAQRGLSLEDPIWKDFEAEVLRQMNQELAKQEEYYDSVKEDAEAWRRQVIANDEWLKSTNKIIEWLKYVKTSLETGGSLDSELAETLEMSLDLLLETNW